MSVFEVLSIFGSLASITALVIAVLAKRDAASARQRLEAMGEAQVGFGNQRVSGSNNRQAGGDLTINGD